MRRVLFFVFCLAWYASVTLTTCAQQLAAEEYTPKYVVCPKGTSLVRHAGGLVQSLSLSEAAYIESKQSRIAPQAWASYLRNVEHAASAQHVALPSYVSNILSSNGHFPHLGISTSGGGHRAAIFGAGILTTLDGRNATSVDVGIGGLLQASTYLASLSGGSWLSGSLYQADFPEFPDLIFGSNATGSDGWNTVFDLTQPSTDPEVDVAYLGEMIAEVAGKFLAGFPVTIGDVWARILSRHFVSGTTSANFFNTNVTHGAGVLFSGIVNLPSFVSRTVPFPIMVSDSVTNLNVGNPVFLNVTDDPSAVPLTNPIYEFTPYEWGSYDPMLSAFTPTKFIGSPNNSLCLTGYDQLAFIEGSSSELFNAENTSASALASSPLAPLFSALQTTFNQSAGIELDTVLWPNAFFGVNRGTFTDTDQKFLRLVDGGEDGEILPLQPLLVKARNVDTIIGIDAPADLDDNFTAGFSLIASQQRASLYPGVYPFPPVPKTVEEFAAHNLTKRPTFFGCNSPSNVPLIIYIANGGPPLGEAPLTNTSTSQTAYQPTQIQAMLNQIHDVATQGIPAEGKDGKLEKDPLWPVCLACAVVEKQRSRTLARRSGVCESCLERYCWS
ncbi:hypothetical protein EUX98_g4967 [Antrodiella citrinella]|uniref:Lysophospholipase n=1 Tax=Antrodiella citrinella TaxID=2447956 RepID=A0A4S4MSW8_9APHY|nr:hypothetical protein EUX98_g4967 [Antrodiella citrinella]